MLSFFFLRIIEILTTEVEYTAMRMLLYVYENKQFYLCELIYFQHLLIYFQNVHYCGYIINWYKPK